MGAGEVKRHLLHTIPELAPGVDNHGKLVVWMPVIVERAARSMSAHDTGMPDAAWGNEPAGNTVWQSR